MQVAGGRSNSHPGFCMQARAGRRDLGEMLRRRALCCVTHHFDDARSPRRRAYCVGILLWHDRAQLNQSGTGKYERGACSRCSNSPKTRRRKKRRGGCHRLPTEAWERIEQETKKKRKKSLGSKPGRKEEHCRHRHRIMHLPSGSSGYVPARAARDVAGGKREKAPRQRPRPPRRDLGGRLHSAKGGPQFDDLRDKCDLGVFSPKSKLPYCAPPTRNSGPLGKAATAKN